MYTTLLLTLPLLVPALANPHSANVKRHHPHLAGPPTPRELLIAEEMKRSVPKAHVGFPPTSNPDSILHVAGMKRDGQKLVRRKKKRACAVTQNPVAAPSASTTLGSGLHASPSNATSEASAASSSSVVAHSASSASFAEASSSAYSASVTEAVSSAVASASSSSSDSYQASSTSSSAAAASSSASSGGLLGGLLDLIWPTGKGSASWTTVTDVANSLSFDGALKPLTAGKLPSSGSAPDGANALIARYPAGTFKYSASTGHGYSFYSQGQKDSVEVTGAKEVVMSYSVYFDSGFEFVRGGKLPGLYGGTSLDNAKSCSGGRQDGRDECFSARLMWRANGAGEIYNYLPSAAYSNPNYCSYPPYSICDPTYGESIGRGSFTFPTGEWTTVAIRLKLNDANVANGEQELFVNGKSVISLTDLMISVNSETKIYGIMAQTFFGGSDSSWASPKDQNAYFKDWSLAVLA